MTQQDKSGEDVMSIEEVKRLIAERDEIDRRIAAEGQILQDNDIDMHRSLVDADGFPITGVDIYSVRRARNAIICAQNDRNRLTAEIEKAMLALHQQKRDSIPSCSSEDTHPEDENQVHRTSNAPFARIAKVMNASPAFEAGIHDDDQIIQFGSLHAGNFNDMKQLSDIVQSSMNKIIRVTVLRGHRVLRLELVPRTWSGKGVLGCAVLPVTSAHLI